MLHDVEVTRLERSAYMGTVESHLQTQRAAVKMLHDGIMLLVKYVTDVIAGNVNRNHSKCTQ